MILTYQDYNRFNMNQLRSLRIPSMPPPMATMRECIDKAVENGYTMDFKADENGLTSVVDEDVLHYQANQITIDNFYRFEGASDPEDNSVLYLITTSDKRKGTLTDAYGMYADENISKLIAKVEEIYKKVPNTHPHS